MDADGSNLRKIRVRNMLKKLTLDGLVEVLELLHRDRIKILLHFLSHHIGWRLLLSGHSNQDPALLPIFHLGHQGRG